MGRRIRTMYADDHSAFQEPFEFKKPTMCLGHFKEQCNIKAILQKYEERDSSPLSLMESAVYTTYDKYYDYQEMRNRMLKIQDDFMRLPSSIRAEFGHNPGNFHIYCQDPNNLEDGIKRGIFFDDRSVVLPVETSEITGDKES